MCGSFFWKISFFSCEGKLKEGRAEKAKLKQKRNQMIFWLSLFIIYGDVIRSPYLSCFFPRVKPLRTCGSFFGRAVFFMFFSCEGKMKEGRTGKSKTKTEKESNGWKKTRTWIGRKQNKNRTKKKQMQKRRIPI
jgi:hypothetical protein